MERREGVTFFILGTCTILSGPGGKSSAIFIHIFGPGFPYLVIIFCYIMIIRKLKKSRNKVLHQTPSQGTVNTNSPHEQKISKLVTETRLTKSFKQVTSIKNKIRNKKQQETPFCGDCKYFNNLHSI